MEKWLEIRKSADFYAWADALGVDPLCARIIRNRGIKTIEEAKKYLYGNLYDMNDPFLLPDMKEAVEGLYDSVSNGEKIGVVGDYDVDGVTSTSILVKCLMAAGADVIYYIPDRVKDGYGISDDIVRNLSSKDVKLIITCDNGIAAASQVHLAYELGIKVIVTDHHQVPFEMDGDIKKEILPECIAVVDPHREGSSYPFRGICGAMVAFKFMQAFCLEHPSAALKDAIEESIQFAALGTVCDIMELKDENRIIVREGIKRIEQTKNPGLRALIIANGLKDKKLGTYALSFIIGPCINSTGRLENAGESVELLLSDDYDKCLGIAVRIRELNDSRKSMTQTGVKKALEIIKKNNMEDDKALVVFIPDIHESIVGLVAGKLKEAYNRPTYVITKAEDGLKGSGRSIPAYNMFEKMNEVKDTFTKFGGHAMAAGFSLDYDKLDEMRNGILENCNLTDEDLVRTITFDAVVPPEFATLKLVQDLEKLEPVGVGNPGALFAAKAVSIVGISRMGKEKQYGNLTAVSGNKKIKLIYFGNMAELDAYIDEKYGTGSAENVYAGRLSVNLDICYEISLGDFRGNAYIDYRLKSYR